MFIQDPGYLVTNTNSTWIRGRVVKVLILESHDLEFDPSVRPSVELMELAVISNFQKLAEITVINEDPFFLMKHSKQGSNE